MWYINAMRTQNFKKTATALRYWLLGRKYHMALKAMEFGAIYHTGVRKDGVTPEYAHQITQVNYLRTLEPWFIYPEEVLAIAFLHDVVEDYDVSLSEIENRFGSIVSTSVELLTKPHDWTEEYFSAMVSDPNAGINKGADRLHNLQSMPDVFTIEKQDKYMEETENMILPMLKNSRRRWPEQEPVYINLKTVLVVQMELIRAVRAGG